MQLEELKSQIKALGPEDRRRLALYVLELEKDRIREKLGPQIAEDIDGLGRAVQDAFDRIKNAFKD